MTEDTKPNPRTLARLVNLCDGDHRLDAKAFDAAAIAKGMVRRHNVSVVAVAKASGIHRTLIHRHRKGQYAPTIETLLAYADALDVSPVRLVKLSAAKKREARLRAKVRELETGQ